VQRKRDSNQQGSLQLRQHGNQKMWVLLYRDEGVRRYETLGSATDLTKTQAQRKAGHFMAKLNARLSSSPDPDITFGQFVEGLAFPFQRDKWKRSTAMTTEFRVRHHLMGYFEEVRLTDLALKQLQEFLVRRAKTNSKSTVAHLRWDLSALFKLAMAQGYVERDPTIALYIPRQAESAPTRVMNREEVEKHIKAMDLRGKVIDHLAIFVGMRPGEILGLQRRHVGEDCSQILIDQRTYRGDIDTPKTKSSRRIVAVPSRTAALMAEWLQVIEDEPDAWVFPSEHRQTPIWRDNLWYREMKPRLKGVGLEWANFQVMRRTHATLGHELGIDPKVSAHQRGHGLGVALNIYTKASLNQRLNAAELLESAVLKGFSEASVEPME